ncbi:hypothetical protein EVAR_20162_1 [Eumeta japonica]|uniref:Uncharacterized protein n=1 Tax=Eumeta variegata TaxID=151549 RepID=A0A4C1UTM0_EUMVA|nr:hypothetical protein EVAR_20162_1 [Eumeta japonica]
MINLPGTRKRTSSTGEIDQPRCIHAPAQGHGARVITHGECHTRDSTADNTVIYEYVSYRLRRRACNRNLKPDKDQNGESDQDQNRKRDWDPKLGMVLKLKTNVEKGIELKRPTSSRIKEFHPKKPAKCESDSRTEGSVQTCKLRRQLMSPRSRGQRVEPLRRLGAAQTPARAGGPGPLYYRGRNWLNCVAVTQRLKALSSIWKLPGSNPNHEIDRRYKLSVLDIIAVVRRRRSLIALEALRVRHVIHSTGALFGADILQYGRVGDLWRGLALADWGKTKPNEPAYNRRL